MTDRRDTQGIVWFEWPFYEFDWQEFKIDREILYYKNLLEHFGNAPVYRNETPNNILCARFAWKTFVQHTCVNWFGSLNHLPS